ncbi:hypothetical protein MIMGU_mgv1a023992mg, partial [Erythranthe guttata]
RVLFAGELEITGDENKHTAGRTRWLAINSTDLMLALLERQTGEFSHDVSKPGPIRVERRIVVLHECLRHRVWIHFSRLPSPLFFPPVFCVSLLYLSESKLSSLYAGLMNE